MEAFHRFRDNVADLIDPPHEIIPRIHNELQEMFGLEVIPFARLNPSILIVGPGDRVEELTAAVMAFNPTQLVAVEPDVNSYKSLIKSWRGYLNKTSPQERDRIKNKVNIAHEPFTVVNEIFDIVIAFSIHGVTSSRKFESSLQHKDKLEELLQKSRDLAVISSNGVLSVRAREGGFFGETQYIDRNLRSLPDLTFCVAKESPYMGLSDDYLWVVKKNEV